VPLIVHYRRKGKRRRTQLFLPAGKEGNGTGRAPNICEKSGKGRGKKNLPSFPGQKKKEETLFPVPGKREKGTYHVSGNAKGQRKGGRKKRKTTLILKSSTSTGREKGWRGKKTPTFITFRGRGGREKILFHHVRGLRRRRGEENFGGFPESHRDTKKRGGDHILNIFPC